MNKVACSKCFRELEYISKGIWTCKNPECQLYNQNINNKIKLGWSRGDDYLLLEWLGYQDSVHQEIITGLSASTLRGIKHRYGITDNELLEIRRVSAVPFQSSR